MWIRKLQLPIPLAVLQITNEISNRQKNPIELKKGLIHRKMMMTTTIVCSIAVKNYFFLIQKKKMTEIPLVLILQTQIHASTQVTLR